MPMFCDTAVLFCEHLFSSEVSDNSGDVSCRKNKINKKKCWYIFNGYHSLVLA